MHPDPRSWRPQAFGRRKPKDLLDPLVEPAWGGVRVLAHVAGGRASLIDVGGEDLGGAHPEIVRRAHSAARSPTRSSSMAT